MKVHEKKKTRRNSLVKFAKRLFKEKPLGAIGAIIVLLLLFVGIFADILAPYGYNEANLLLRLKAPSAAFPLGTDNLGRDMLSRIIYGAQISMIVSISAALLSTVIATALGACSGYFGGRFDFLLMRFVDGFMCIPSLVFMMVVIAVIGPGMVPMILILGIQGGLGGSVRIIRSAVLAIRKTLYIEAAEAMGVKAPTIIGRHVIPNVKSTIIVMFIQSMGGAIVSEATLSFLGLGIQPPMPSWGGMLSLSGRSYMLTAPWMAFWPGLCLSVSIIGINLFGDALRDLLDPRQQGNTLTGSVLSHSKDGIIRGFMEGFRRWELKRKEAELKWNPEMFSKSKI